MKTISHIITSAFFYFFLLPPGVNAQNDAFLAESTKPNPIPDEFVLARINGRVNPELIDDSQGITFFISLIQGVNERGGVARLSFIEHLGITESDFSELILISNSIENELAIYGENARNELCNSSDFKINLTNQTDIESLQTSLEDVGSRIGEVTNILFQDEITEFFGENTYNYLIDWIKSNINPTINMLLIDHHKRDLALGRNPYDRVLMICK